MNIHQAFDEAKAGKGVARKIWRCDDGNSVDPEIPSFLVFIAARSFVPDREPMVNFVKKEMHVDDHFDAIFMFDDDTARCTLGYNFSQSDMFADDWEIVDPEQFAGI